MAVVAALKKDFQLPQAAEAEQALLSAAINDPLTTPEIAALIDPEDFYSTDHQNIWHAVFRLASDSIPPDLPNLLAKLKEMGHLGNGMGGYLGKLLDYPVSVDISTDAAIVRKAAAHRRALAESSRLFEALKEAADLDEIRPNTVAALQKIRLALDESEHVTKTPWDEPVDLLPLIDTSPPPLHWFAKDRMPQGRGVLICGVGGSSKTTLLKQLAVGAVLGRAAWDWTISRTGRAVLVLTEDVAEEIHRSIHNICDGLHLSRADRQSVYAGIVCYPMAGKACNLLEKDSTGAMVETALFRSLEKRIVDFGDVVFVGLDPALSLTTGDEMDQGHQRALGRMADNLAVRTGALVALVSHATKASLNKEELDSHNSRGGGAITDAVRAEYSMRTMTATEARQAGIEDLEERKRHVQLVATKGNSLPPEAFVPIWLRRDSTGTMSQVDLVFTAGSHGPNKNDMDALNILKRLAESATPALKEWRDECVNQGIVEGPTRDARTKAMQRITGRLSKAELIRRGFGKGIWLPGGQDEI